jgi:hypothetical protein
MDRQLIENTAEQLSIQTECAKAAGIYDAMFLSFGSLLGHCRENGVIEFRDGRMDDDMDLSICSWMIENEQSLDYLERIKAKGLDRYRWNKTLSPDGKPWWCSIRLHPVERGMKCCHWWFFNYGGYSWHYKGPAWSSAKGCPEHLIEIGPEVEFLGVKIHIPKKCGELLHAWYPNWAIPKPGGASDAVRYLEMRDWSDQNTWSIKNG